MISGVISVHGSQLGQYNQQEIFLEVVAARLPPHTELRSVHEYSL